MKEPWLHPKRDAAAASWFEGPLESASSGRSGHWQPRALGRKCSSDSELLQVGAWGPARHLLDGARTQHTTFVSPELGPGVTLCAPLDSLPLRSDSIDAIFLPHTLELVEDPYAVLREAERVLCAEGCLMICGFNPLSGWGARHAFARHFKRPAFPPRHPACSVRAAACTRRWVAVLGFDVDESVHGYLGLLPSKGAPHRAPSRSPRAAALGWAVLTR